MKIIVVDDDKIIRKGIKKIIQSQSIEHSILEAANGLEAYEIIKLEQLELLITDIKMPVLNGLELIKKIIDEKISIKIIVISGFDEYKYIRESLKNGAIDYLLKPIENDLLVQNIKKIEELLIVDRMLSVKEKNEKNLIENSYHLMQEDLIKEMIMDDIAINYELLDKLKECNIPFHIPYIMLALSASYTNLKPIKKSLYLALYAEFSFVSVVIIEGKIISFIQDDRLSNWDKRDLFKSLNHYHQQIKEIHGIDISIGVSLIQESISKIKVAYEQATLAVQESFYKIKNEVLPFDNMNFLNSDSYDHLMQFNNTKVLELLHLIEIEAYEVASQKYNNLIETMKEKNLQPSLVKKQTVDIWNKMKSLFFESIFVAIDEDITKSILEADTYWELKKVFARLLYEYIKLVKYNRANKSISTIDKAKSYIHKFYYQSITLNHLAEEAQLNPTYLSELFKKECGVNFYDYLINIRMNEAKNLLKNPTLKIFEIAIKVGYDNSTSFNRAFHRKFGISPSSYRKIVK